MSSADSWWAARARGGAVELPAVLDRLGAAIGAVADEVINIIKAYKNTGKPLNGVNQRQKSTAQNNLVVRHFNQVGVLAGVFDALRYEKINIEEMENMIFETGCAASCSLKLDVQPSAALIEKIASGENIIQVMMK